VVGVLNGDLVAEVSRRTGAGVCDQSLVLGEFQREVITQERGEASLDLLGFDLRSNEPEEVIVCVADVLQPPVAGISGILAGQAVKLLAQLSFCGLATSDEPPVRWVAGADAIAGVEQKANDLLAQVEAHRELSSSLSHDAT
jgi:hypothetical protein